MTEERNRILVVDDELGPRESLKLILEDDYEVATAENGSQALDYISTADFDMVILDIRMPDINGIDLLSKVKKSVPETEIVMITAYASVDTATKALRNGALDYLIKPFDCKSVLQVVEKGLARRAKVQSIKNKMEKLQVTNKALAQEIELASQNIQKHFLDTVSSLIAAVDAKDSYTKNHQKRVVKIALTLGREIGLPMREMEKLRQAAALHDIGKIGVPEEILQKSCTLEAAEFDIIRQHPIIGAKIISPVRFLKEVIPLVFHHHERFDGTGYPQGIKGENIPLGARIITIADAIDAMLSTRPYSAAKTPEEVDEQLRIYSGTQFDPALADLALRLRISVQMNYS